MKGGKVRCGHCHQVFNAQDNLLADPATESATTAVPGAAPASAPANPPSESQAIAVQALPRGVEGVRAEAPPLESARDAGLVAARFQKVTLPVLLAVVLFYQLAGTLGEWALSGSLFTALQDFRIGIPGMLLQVVGGYWVIRKI